MKGSVCALALCCLVAAADARWLFQISQITGLSPDTVPGPLGTGSGAVVAQPAAQPAVAQPMAAAGLPTGPADTAGAVDPAAAAQAAVQAATAAAQPAAGAADPFALPAAAPAAAPAADPFALPAAAPAAAPAADPFAVPAAAPAAVPVAAPAAAPAAPARPSFPSAFPDVPATGTVLGRTGIQVLADPPAVPVATEAPAGNVTAVGPAARRNVTGPTAPVAGTNLMLILNMAAAEQRDIYKNQQQIRQQVAALSGVDQTRVLFFNQTGNTDRTGNTVMSLVLNVRCGDPSNCGRVGKALFNSTNQATLTQTLARGGVSLIPNTTQVYGVQAMGNYQGNATLDETFRLGGPAKLPTTLSPTAGLPTSLPTTLDTAALGLPGAGGLGGLATGVTLTPLGADALGANATTEVEAPAPAPRSSAGTATASVLAALAAATIALVL